MNTFKTKGVNLKVSQDMHLRTLYKGRNIMECRLGCAACCIAPSISSNIPGMPKGKPAGVRCIQLTEDNKCKLFGKDERPKVCGDLKSSKEMCRKSSMEAHAYLVELEESTAPNRT